MKILFILLAALSSLSWKAFDLDSVSFKAAKFDCNRDPGLTPLRQCDEYTGRAAFEINLRIFEFLYWKNDVHTEAVPAAVKTVGWHWEFGLKLTPQIELFREHHSRHIMDEPVPKTWDDRNSRAVQNKYPVEDSVGIRVHFWINPKPQDSLFN